MPTKDTDNPKFRRQQAVKKLTHIFRKHGLKAVSVLALSGGVWHANHNYINADIHFLEAMDAQDTADMQHYAGNLVIQSDIDTVMERIAQEGQIEPLRIVFEEAEDQILLGEQRQRHFNAVVSDNIDDYITSAIQNGHYEFLITFAEELGQRSLHSDIFIRLLNEADGEAAAEYLEAHHEIDMTDFIALLPELREQVTDEIELNLFFVNHIDSITRDYSSGGMFLHIPADNSPENMSKRRGQFLEALLNHGYHEAATLIFEEYRSDENVQLTYLKHFAVQGELDPLIQAAENSYIANNHHLQEIAVQAALAGHHDISVQFANYYTLDLPNFFSNLLISALHRDNQDAARFALRSQVIDGGERKAIITLSVMVESHTDLVFDLVKENGHLFNPENRETLINLFDGTLDDHLRRHFEMLDNVPLAPEEQARPQVSRPAYKLP